MKCVQIRSLLRIWSHLLKKSLMGNFIFCAVKALSLNSQILYLHFDQTPGHRDVFYENRILENN